jgi:hypothetical protein
LGIASEKPQESLSNLGVEQSSKQKRQGKHENEQDIQSRFQSKKSKKSSKPHKEGALPLLMSMFTQTGCRKHLSILRGLGHKRLDHVRELVQKLGDHVHVLLDLCLDRVSSSRSTGVGNGCNVDRSSLDWSRGRSLGIVGHCWGRCRVGRRGSSDVLHRCRRRGRGRWRLSYRGGDVFLIIIVLPFLTIFVIVFILVLTVLDGRRGWSRRGCRGRRGGRGRRWSNWAR